MTGHKNFLNSWCRAVRDWTMAILCMSFILFPSLACAFTAASLGDYGNVSVMQVSGNYDAHNPDGSVNSAPREVITREFFKTHKDEYDFVVIFSNFDYKMPANEVHAFYLTIKNDVRGIGQELFDFSSEFGSNGRLQGTIDMGNLAGKTSDPTDPHFESTLSILAHEMLHRWGAWVKFKEADGTLSTKLLGKDGSHWSYLLDTKGSVQYGNQWRDNGDGTFTSLAAKRYFSPLDLYLMGLLDKSQVPPMLLIDNPDLDPATMSQSSATITGASRLVTIDDIIAAEGERFPAAKDAQKQFKMAFIFVTGDGNFSGDQLAGLENIRNGFLTRFSILTDGQALVQVASTPKEDLPINPGIRPVSTTPRALPPSIDDGVSWLMSHQQTDGSWVDFSLTTARDTAEVVASLQRFPVARQQLQGGLQWLAANVPANVDYLARRIETVAASGGDASLLLQDLVGRRNLDGGWGSARDFESNPTDTALALKALARAGYADQSVVAKAVAYLQRVQNSDGGWSGGDSMSTIQPTAAVLSAFDSYRKNYSLDGNISRGVVFLSGKQNADGGFGNSPSTVYDSAVAIMALQESGADREMVSRGVAYLTELQTGEGSWQESPYQTALAVRALWQASVDPDLAIESDDITFIPEKVTSLPTDAVLNAVIRNLGRGDVPQVKVALYRDAVAAGNQIGEQVVAIPGMSPVSVTFSVPVTEGAGRAFHVVVDPDNLVTEPNNNNNSAVKLLLPEATYDFELLAADLAVAPNPAEMYQEVRISAKIANRGTMNAYSVPVRFFIDEGGTPVQIATTTVDIPAGGTATKEVSWKANRTGVNLAVTVQADPSDAVAELREDNNKLAVPLTVHGSTKPNLTLTYQDVVATPNPAQEKGSATISAVVGNDGFSTAENVKVSCYLGAPNQGGILLGSRVLPALLPQQRVTTSFEWKDIAESGSKVVSVVLDPDNAIQEISEDDNFTYTSLAILTLPDLAISATSVAINPSAPKTGDQISISITVQNRGEQDAANVVVRVSEGANSVGSTVIPVIRGNSQATAVVPYPAGFGNGTHRVTVAVDPEQLIAERTEENNSAAREFAVQDASLWLSNPYFSPNGDGVKDTTDFSFRLDAATAVTVAVVDKKGERVRSFHDGVLENTQGSVVTWDGKNDDGVVVGDGAYQIQVIDTKNSVMGTLAVFLDTNRSPMSDAIGSKFSHKASYPAGLPGYDKWQWLPEEKGIVLYIKTGNDQYPPGLYLMAPDGSEIVNLTPREWGEDLQNTYSGYEQFKVSPDGERLAFVVLRNFKNRTVENFTDERQLVLIDLSANSRTVVESAPVIYKYYRRYWDTYPYAYIMQNFYTIDGFEWMPDGRLLYQKKLQAHVTAPATDLISDTFLYDVSQSSKTVVLSTAETVSYAISPDGGSVAYYNNWGLAPYIRILNLQNGISTNNLHDSEDLERYDSYKVIDNVRWSDTGSQLVFRMSAVIGSSAAKPYTIKIVDRSGAAGKTLVSEPFGDLSQQHTVEWLANDNLLLTQQNIAYGQTYPKELYIVEPGVDGAVTKINTGSDPRGAFGVSPDKKRIAFSDLNVFTRDVKVSDCTGKVTTVYSTVEEAVVAPVVWAPDSTKIAFHASGYRGDWPNYIYFDFDAMSDLASGKRVTFAETYGRIWYANLSQSDQLKWEPASLSFVRGECYYYLYGDYEFCQNLSLNDTVTGGTTRFSQGEETRRFDISPMKGIFTNEMVADANVSSKRLSMTSYLANLTADLRVANTRSALSLSGTAQDVNFEGFKLEYAEAGSPGVWNLVAPPSDQPVVSGSFATWVPPNNGSFLVRLTVWDKAGNTRVSKRRITWGSSSSGISSLYKTGDFISPNGDGADDAVSLHYKVHGPVHLEFSVVDPEGSTRRTFVKEYASAADDSISWDGRDESGNVVPDGRYKIKVFDYEFFVEVDTETPKAGINIGQLQFDDARKFLYVDLSVLASDSNIKSWRIDYGVGDNPQEWHQYSAGNDVLVAKDAAGAPLSPVQAHVVQRYYDQSIASLTGRKFRVTVEDFAGNTSSAISGFAEEKVVLSNWDDAFIVRNLNDVHSTAIIPAENAGSSHAVKGFSTLRAPAVSAVLQYWNGKQWLDTAPSTAAASGLLEFAWESPSAGLNAGFALRAKVVDSLGGVHLSNTLSTADMFSLDSSCSTAMPLLGQNSLSDTMKLLKLQVQSGQDANYPNWTDYHLYDAAKGDPIPAGQFAPPLPIIKSGMSYRIRMLGIGSNGQLYTSESGSYPPSCPLQLSLELTYDEAKGCGETAPGMVSLVAAAKNSPSNISLRTLSFYLRKAEGFQLLEQFDILREGWKDYTLSTSGLLEGTHPVKAEVSYLDLNDNKLKSADATAVLTVDRVLPAPRMTYPAGSSTRVCPVKAAGSAGEYTGIPVEGVVADNLQVKRYELSYGSGENPSEWLPATAPALDLGNVVQRQITGAKAMQGRIGTWNTAGLPGGVYSVRLKVIDGSGNVSCATNTVSFDSAINIATISADRPLFSPNGDGVADEVKLSFQTDKLSTVAAKIFKVLATGGLDTSPLRVLSSGTSFPAGAQNLFWDGRTDAGAAVSDSRYGMAVSATDSCGNSVSKWAPVEVDQTPPTAVIGYPKPSDSLPPGNVIEVSGSVADSHFASHTLEAGEGDSPTAWTTISGGVSRVDAGLLGAWNTYGLTGKWTLRLTALDTVGNKTSSSSTVDLGARKSLIKTVEIAPRLFSPNNDGKSDTAVIGYELAEACRVTADILDSTGTVVRSFAADSLPAGNHSFRWDGRNSAATLAADGSYQVKLTASLLSNPANNQMESLTVVVDTGLPQIDLKQPADKGYLNTSKVAVTGSISDPNLLGYSVKVTGPAGNVLQESGNQSRTDFGFGEADNQPEGDYLIVAEATDLGENKSRVTRAFTVDRTAPGSTLATPKGGEYYGAENNLISVTGSLEEKNLERFSLRYGVGETPAQWQELAGGTTVGALPETRGWKVGKDDGVADGLYTISLWAKDKAGLEGEARVKVTVDNTPPVVAFASIHDGDYIRGALDVSGDLVDANLDKGVLELAEGSCAAATRWSPLKSFTTSTAAGLLMGWKILPADGDYCLKLSAIDKAGNKASVAAGVKISTHPPAAPVLSGELSNKSTVLLSWANGEADLAGYNLYRDGQKLNTALLTGLSYTDSDLKDGTYAYTLTAVNQAGGESSVSAAVKSRVDTLGPEARFSMPPGAKLHDVVEVKGTASSADDFKEYRLYVGQGQNPSAWTLVRKSPVPVKVSTLAELDTTALPDGAYALKLEAEDLTGNVTAQTVSATVDNTPPSAPVLVSAVKSANEVTLTWTATPEPDARYLLYRNDQLANGAGVAVTNPKPYLIAGTSYLDKMLPDGQYAYYLVAVDATGNIGSVSNSLAVDIDMRPPHATIADPADHAKFEDRIVVKADSVDNDIVSVQFQYKGIQHGTWTNLGTPVTSAPFMTYLDPELLGLAHGDFQLQSIATDSGGRQDPAPSSIAVTYTDLTPPAIPADLRAVATGNGINLSWRVVDDADGGYAIYRTSGTAVTRLIGNGPLYQDLNLADGRYSYTVAALDSFGNESGPSGSVSVAVYAPVLAQPYTPVTQPSLSITGRSAAPNASVELFRISEAGETSLGRTVADLRGDFRFDDLVLTLGRNDLAAKATDGGGNTSRPSETVAVVYSQPPAQPAGLAATVDGYAVSLAWAANAETDIAGYNIYRDGAKLNGAAPAFASGVASSSIYSYNAGQASDGTPNSVWWSQMVYGGPFAAAWWQIDFPNRELVNHLEINWYESYTSYAGKDFEVQAWSGQAWIPLAKVQGNTLKDNFFTIDPPYPADKIRIAIADSVDSYYKQVGIREVKIRKETLVPDRSYRDAGLMDKRYGYSVTAVNKQGLESQQSAVVPAEVGDVLPPAAPQGVAVVVTGSSALLSWSQNGEGDLGGYNIYRKTGETWQKVNAAAAPVPTFSEANLVNGTYRWRITAVDNIGNESVPSSEVTSTIAAGSPPPPGQTRIVAPQEGKSLTLSWDAAGGTTAGYVLYRGLATGGPYQLVTTVGGSDLGYTDSGLVNGTTYYYLVAAQDAIGNESVPSSEASGTPFDLMAPGTPRVFTPAAAGETATVYSGSTDLAGIAEPGVTVELFKEGVSLGKTVASTSETTAKVRAVGYSPVPSPDGSRLVYQDSSNLMLMEFSSGTAEKIVASGWGAKWSAGGGKIAFKYVNGSDTRIGIYDVGAKKFAPLTDYPTVYEDSPSLSADGSKVAYTSNKNGSLRIWVKDLNTGVEKETTFYGSAPTISPDGARISYYNGYTLVVAGISDGSVQQINNTDSSTFAWSPSGRKMLYQSYRELDGIRYLHVRDLETQNVVQITTDGVHRAMPVWSPDEQQVAFGKNGALKREVLVMDMSGQTRKVTEVGSLGYLAWGRNGTITAYDAYTQDVHTIRPPGQFFFDEVAVDPGENALQVTAGDETGNTSDASEPVTVVFDGSAIPDLVMSSDSVYLFPVFPKPGAELTVNAVVHNTGNVSVDNVEVEIYLWSSEGELQLIGSEVIPHIEGISSSEVAVRLNAGAAIGSQSVIVSVDPGNKIGELSEHNNLASQDFYATDREEVTVGATLDSEQYGSGQDATVTVALTNSGNSRDGLLEVRVEDVDGNLVATLASSAGGIPYGINSYSYVWNTASTFAGSYRARVVFKDADQGIIESNSPFTIIPDELIDGSVISDKGRYGANEPVSLTVAVTNGGSNVIVPALRARVRIVDSSNTEIYVREKNLEHLFPSAGVSFSSEWNTGISAPGNYSVFAELYLGDKSISSASTEFVIDAVSRVTGTVVVNPAAVAIGSSFKAAISAYNSGNTPASGILKAVLIKPETGAVVASMEQQLELAVNGSRGAEFSFSSEGLSLQAYQVRVYYLSQGGTKVVGSATVAVKDTAAPTLSVVAPLAAATYTGTVRIEAVANDDASGVARVEYQLDGGTWSPLAPVDPAQGRYATTWEPDAITLPDHTVSFRGVDRSGNQSAPVSVSFQVQMDSTPPFTTIDLDGPRYELAEKLYVSSGTLFTLTASDDFSGVANTEYRINGGAWSSYAPFTLSTAGENSVYYRSVDRAGNPETEKSLTLWLDKDAPVTTLTASDPLAAGDGNSVSPKTVFTLTATDTGSGVKQTWYRIDEGQWLPFNEGFTLDGMMAGTHSIQFHALDQVGNEEEPRSVTVRLIRAEFIKEISADSTVLVGAWIDNQNKVRNQKALDAVNAILSSRGGEFHIAQDGDDFKAALRSGKYNTYLLIDYKDEKVGGELREAVNYGDSLLYIKTKPGADPSFQDLFGTKLTGESTDQDVPVLLSESRLTAPLTLQSSGKCVVASVVADTASALGYAADKRGPVPAVVYNEYGAGKVVLFTFDLLNSTDKVAAAGLLGDAVTLVKPKWRKSHALGAVPIVVTVANSREALGLRLSEAIAPGSVASDIAPEATRTETGFDWMQELEPSQTVRFRYYLNLPDMKGEYKSVTEVSYANQQNFRPYVVAELALTVSGDSSDLLSGAISDLAAVTATAGEKGLLADARNTLSQVDLNPPTAKDAEKEIESLTRVLDMLGSVSGGAADARIKLDELLKIMGRKWYLLSVPGDEGGAGTST